MTGATEGALALVLLLSQMAVFVAVQLIVIKCFPDRSMQISVAF